MKNELWMVTRESEAKELFELIEKELTKVLKTELDNYFDEASAYKVLGIVMPIYEKAKKFALDEYKLSDAMVTEVHSIDTRLDGLEHELKGIKSDIADIGKLVREALNNKNERKNN